MQAAHTQILASIHDTRRIFVVLFAVGMLAAGGSAIWLGRSGAMRFTAGRRWQAVALFILAAAAIGAMAFAAFLAYLGFGFWGQ